MNKNYANYSNKNKNINEVKVEVKRDDIVADQNTVALEMKPEYTKKNFAKNISGKFLNLRQKPNQKSEILKKIPNESKMKIIERLHDWTKVEFEGTTGFVMNEFIEEV